MDGVAAKKRTLIKQGIDKKDKRVRLREIEEEESARWRGDKKAAVVKMKKTEITVPKAIKRRIRISEAIRVGELAKQMGVRASDVINKLLGLGIMVTINQSIDVDAASLIAAEFGYQVEAVTAEYDERMATAVRNVVRRTRSRLIPSTPTWYSAPSQPIQGVRSVNCIPGTSRRKPPYSVSDTRNVATDTAKARCLMADSRCRSRQRRRATPASGRKVTMETMGNALTTHDPFGRFGGSAVRLCGGPGTSGVRASRTAEPSIRRAVERSPSSPPECEIAQDGHDSDNEAEHVAHHIAGL